MICVIVINIFGIQVLKIFTGNRIIVFSSKYENIIFKIEFSLINISLVLSNQYIYDNFDWVFYVKLRTNKKY